jgi:Cys-tRNA(Pro)/Cys-tRNA(Cys) deacylase
MTTRGIQFLEQKEIAHEIIRYDHQEKGAQFAARAVGFALCQTIKTLVVALDGNQFVQVLMPGDRELSMKKVAKVCGTKRAAMADTATAERLTGYLAGGISPFGSKKRLPVIMESALQDYQQVMVNAGQRGIMVKLAPSDIIRTLDATVTELSHPAALRN